MLKKKNFGYSPKKGKLSASSTDFFKASLIKTNSSVTFSPKKSGNFNNAGLNGIGKSAIIKKNPVAATGLGSKNSLSGFVSGLSKVSLI